MQKLFLFPKRMIATKKSVHREKGDNNRPFLCIDKLNNLSVVRFYAKIGLWGIVKL